MEHLFTSFYLPLHKVVLEVNSPVLSGSLASEEDVGQKAKKIWLLL